MFRLVTTLIFFKIWSTLNERQLKAVEYVKVKGKITNKEYQEINLVAKPTATRDLSELVEYGIFKNTGKGAGSYYEIIGS